MFDKTAKKKCERIKQKKNREKNWTKIRSPANPWNEILEKLILIMSEIPQSRHSYSMISPSSSLFSAILFFYIFANDLSLWLSILPSSLDLSLSFLYFSILNFIWLMIELESKGNLTDTATSVRNFTPQLEKNNKYIIAEMVCC